MKNKWKYIALAEAMVLVMLVIVSCNKREHDYDDSFSISYRKIEDYSYSLCDIEDALDKLYDYCETPDDYDDINDLSIYSLDSIREMQNQLDVIQNTYNVAQEKLSKYL